VLSDRPQNKIGNVGAGARVAQGENITIIETLNKVDLTKLPEFIKAFTDREAISKELLDEATRKRDEIAADLKFTHGAVEGFFQTLGEQNVPPEQLKPKLIEIASQFEEARQRLATLDPDDPVTKALADQARVELEKGQNEAAEALLQRAEEAELAAAAQARALAQQATAAADARQLHAAKARENRGDVALIQLRYAEAAEHFGVAAALLPASSSNDMGRLLWRQAEALHRQGDERGDNDALRGSIEIFRSVLETLTRERVPLKWAATQHNLGIALQILGQREGSTAWLEEAVSAFRKALQETPREQAPSNWAMTQICLGNTFTAIGELNDDTMKLKEAVVTFRAALEEMPRERVPIEWAMTQSNLGNALVALGEREGGTAGLEEAVKAYSDASDALQKIARERIQFEWATIQNNLGYALTDLGCQEPGTATLKRAVVVCHDALKTQSREQRPLEWARTQHTLGNALLALGEREARTTWLEEAVAAYIKALQERTYERVPLEWATTQSNLGNALLALGRREVGVARLEEAIAAFDACLTVIVTAWPAEWVQQVRSYRDEARTEIARQMEK
jgi:tetratricopeptide (TPR) repeat protein